MNTVDYKKVIMKALHDAHVLGLEDFQVDLTEKDKRFSIPGYEDKIIDVEPFINTLQEMLMESMPITMMLNSEFPLLSVHIHDANSDKSYIYLSIVYMDIDIVLFTLIPLSEDMIEAFGCDNVNKVNITLEK